MATDVRGHTAPAAGETPRRQVLNDLSLSINDVVMAANPTARAQALTDIGASTARALFVWQSDTEELWVHNGARWRLLAGAGRSIVGAGNGGVGTTEQQVSGSVLTLPAGRWEITATGWVEWACDSPPTYILRLRVSSAAVDTTRVQTGLSGLVPFTLHALADLSGSSNIDLTAQLATAVGGVRLVQGVSIVAVPA